MQQSSLRSEIWRDELIASFTDPPAGLDNQRDGTRDGGPASQLMTPCTRRGGTSNASLRQPIEPLATTPDTSATWLIPHAVDEPFAVIATVGGEERKA